MIREKERERERRRESVGKRAQFDHALPVWRSDCESKDFNVGRQGRTSDDRGTTGQSERKTESRKTMNSENDWRKQNDFW
jgi:hypothetical protein